MPDQENEGTSEGGALREQLEKALKELKEAKDAISAAETERTDEKLTTFLSAKKVDPSIKEFVPKDIGADSAKLDAWWTEKGKFFAGAVGTTDEDQTGETANDDADAAAWQGIQGVSSAASGATNDKVSAFERSLKPDATPEEVLAAGKAMGL